MEICSNPGRDETIPFNRLALACSADTRSRINHHSVHPKTMKTIDEWADEIGKHPSPEAARRIVREILRQGFEEAMDCAQKAHNPYADQPKNSVGREMRRIIIASILTQVNSKYP